jgi:hypothetical protein
MICGRGDGAVEDFIEEWEERRYQELAESLSNKFEDGLEEQVDAEMAGLPEQEELAD